MAHTITMYDKAKVKILDGTIDLDTATLKVALLKSGYTPDFDANEFASSFTAYELNVAAGGTGYQAGYAGTGRKTLAGAAITQISTGAKFDGNDVTFPTLGADLDAVYGAVLYKHETSDAASRLIAYIDFDPNFVPDGNDLTIQWNTDGILKAE